MLYAYKNKYQPFFVVSTYKPKKKLLFMIFSGARRFTLKSLNMRI